MAGEITIRHPLDSEREQLALLNSNTFRGELEQTRRWAEKADLSEILCLVESTVAGPRIVSSINVNSYESYVGGEAMGMGGIGGVMTAAERQGRGYAGRLMCEGFKFMRRRGQVLSTLYPFSHTYYAKLGYALVVERLIYENLQQWALPRHEEFRLVDRFLPGDAIDELIGPHDQIMQRYNLGCRRSAEGWQKFLERLQQRKGFVYVIRDGARVIGWFGAVNGRLDTGGHESQTFSVVLADRRAMRAMLGMLARLPTPVKRILLCMPPDFELWDELKEPEPAKRKADVQGRVIDLAVALKRRGYRGGVSGRLVFRVNDPQARWNHGTWRANWSGGELVSIARTKAAPQLVADIGPFTQIFCGYRSARDLAAVDKVKAGSPAALDLLDELFRDRPPYIQDWF